jgi:hypothetical protein
VTDSWQPLGAITSRLIDKLSPVTFSVDLNGPLAAAVRREAKRLGNKESTIIAEAVRSYLGDAA